MCTCIYDAPAPAITRQTDQSGGSPHRSDQQGACTVWSSPPKLGKRWTSAQSPARGAPDFAHRRIRLGREEFCVLFGYLTGTVRGILSMEVIPARHRGNAHLHLPRHWFADPLKFGPILSEPVCFLSSLHPDKPHGARCRDSQIHHSCTQAEGGGGGLGRAGVDELSPVRKRGQCAPAFTMHQRRRSLDRLTRPEDRHTAVISRVLAPSGARLLSWASDGHRPKAQLEGPQTLLIAGFGWDEKNSVCYLAISQATVRGILSMEVIPARHWGDAHLHLPRHWFADTLKFGPILSEPVCFLSSLHPDKPHGARCRDSQIHHSCTQAEGGGGGWAEREK